MLFDLLVIGFFVFKLPALAWLAAIFCLVRHIVRDLNPKIKAKKELEWQKTRMYLEMWQDDQGF